MKKSNLKTAVLSLVVMVFGLAFSNAQPKGDKSKKPPTYSELLKDLDKNEDGKLSEEELKGPLKNDFAKIDTNEDGFLSKEEFEEAPKPKARERKKNK
ncbi:EF-hand domain-containing protein [Aequorivita sp. Q41]|uniref:EF-hand domain-containing protein n=1 Tax=Aequorivita sp. Q41 TaxID=3153300 RepID=UPI003242939E